MTREKRGPLLDDDEGPSARTNLELRSPYEVPPPDGTRVSDETLPVTSGFRVAPSVQGFRLVSEQDGSSAEVTSGVAQVGSDSGNDLVLSHPTVSRFHCEVKLSG